MPGYICLALALLIFNYVPESRDRVRTVCLRINCRARKEVKPPFDSYNLHIWQLDGYRGSVPGIYLRYTKNIQPDAALFIEAKTTPEN